MATDRIFVDKLKQVAKSLEQNKGRLRLFAAVWKDDIKRWDILVSASWVDYERMKENIGDIFDALKQQFNGEFVLRISGIHPLKVTEPLVTQLTKMVNVDEGGDLEFENVQVNNLNLERVVVIVSRQD
jgi:hypothetical protein